MFLTPKKPLHIDFDEQVSLYLIHLAHVKNSIVLTITEKSDFLKTAESISHDIFVSSESIKSKGVNQFNRAEVDATLEAVLRRIRATIALQLKAISRSVVIDPMRIHSVKAAVESLSATGPNLVVFSRDKIDRMYAFRQYFGQVKRPLDVRKETAKAMAAEDKAMYDLSLKAFKEMMLGPRCDGVERYFAAVSHIDSLLVGGMIPLVAGDAYAGGLAFVQDESAIVIRYSETSRSIEIRLGIDRGNSHLSIAASGFDEQEGKRGSFDIEQRYSASLYSSVITTYRLRKILDVHALSCSARG